MMSLSTRPVLRLVAVATMLVAGGGTLLLLRTGNAGSQQIGASKSLLAHFSDAQGTRTAKLPTGTATLPGPSMPAGPSA